MPPGWLGWKQYRALGAAALDLCAVAAGVVDAYIDCSRSAHGPWDYLGGLLVCTEAGAVVADADGRDLVVPRARRPAHARSPRPRPRCSTQALAARRTFASDEARLHRLALRRVPRAADAARRLVVRLIAPTFSVGAILRRRATATASCSSGSATASGGACRAASSPAGRAPAAAAIREVGRGGRARRRADRAARRSSSTSTPAASTSCIRCRVGRRRRSRRAPRRGRRRSSRPAGSCSATSPSSSDATAAACLAALPAVGGGSGTRPSRWLRADGFVDGGAQLLRHARVAQLRERLRLDLAGPLAGHREAPADLLERARASRRRTRSGARSPARSRSRSRPSDARSTADSTARQRGVLGRRWPPGSASRSPSSVPSSPTPAERETRSGSAREALLDPLDGEAATLRRARPASAPVRGTRAARRRCVRAR